MLSFFRFTRFHQNLSDSSSRSESVNSTHISTNNNINGTMLHDRVMWSDDEDDDYLQYKVEIEFFTHEKRIKQRLRLCLIKNQRSSVRIRILYFTLKIISCVIYLVTVGMDNPETATCYNCPPKQQADDINLRALFWVSRPLVNYIAQVIIAILCLTETLLLIIVEYKGNILQQIMSYKFILEVVCSLPFLASVAHPMLRNLYVLSFLNCWLAKLYLENMMNDLQLMMMRSQSNLFRQVLLLFFCIFCLGFTCMCGFQYLERAYIKHSEYDFWMSLWFVVVTFSTVGYGDITPSWLPSRIFIMGTICAALIIIPVQLEKLAFCWRERQKQGGSYSSHRADSEHHVILCATYLSADLVLDFLNEFFAHPTLQDYFVVMLSPTELDPTVNMILQVPIWSQRVVYLQGSALRDQDLMRAKADRAECCFILASRHETDRSKADRATILRTWAVKDFAPQCPLYVQILQPENKFHINFADHVVCEDELKFALLANNCVCPAVTTFVTLLLHTLRGRQSHCLESWQNVYAKSSGQEIYDRQAKGSMFFKDFIGKSFTYAAFNSHKKFGVSLIGVQAEGEKIILNPGPVHIMKETDICYYINTTREELSSLVPPKDKRKSVFNIHPDLLKHGNGSVRQQAEQITSLLSAHQSENNLQVTTRSGNRRPSIMPVSEECQETIKVPEPEEGDVISDSDWNSEILGPHPKHYVRNYPDLTPYTGFTPPLCYLHQQPYKVEPCCLDITDFCQHKRTRLRRASTDTVCQSPSSSTSSCPSHTEGSKGLYTAMDYPFHQKVVIVSTEIAQLSLVNFIVPLRHYCRKRYELYPIIFLIEKPPDRHFVDVISAYPLVYFMVGRLQSLNDLLMAGINKAETVIVVDRESTKVADEEYMADAETIVAVQTIFKLFPSVNIITELTHPSNMRFMQFKAQDYYAHQLTKSDKKGKNKSNVSYLFRLPFIAGRVFSASMLDTLLYQSCAKPYIISIVNLLLGLDQQQGSGHLSYMRINQKDMWIRTFGRLYQRLCSVSYEIPIGIYRTVDPDQQKEELLNDSPDKNKKKQKKVKPEIHVEIFSTDDDENNPEDFLNWERQQLNSTVKQRMAQLEMRVQDYNESDCDKRRDLSYVIVNPDYDFRLQPGDVIYLIRPPKNTASPMLFRRQPPKPTSFRRGGTFRKNKNHSD